jgi:hypothetical protein
VYAYYLTDAYENVTFPLLSIPNGPEPFQFLVRHSHRKAREEELERRYLSEIREDVIYAEAEEGYSALSTLLGEHKYFFNERCVCFLEGTNCRRPGLLDAAVFAYTWTVLDKLGQSSLATIINKYENLVHHSRTLHSLVYLRH